MTVTLQSPPLTENEDGQTRQVGIELEFSSLSSQQSAELIRKRFGGEIISHDPHHYEVRDTQLGSFDCKLDVRYAHPSEDKEETAKRLLSGWVEEEKLNNLLRRTESFIGDLSQGWVPTEIVGPPIPYPQIPLIDELVGDLIAEGAEGTESSWAYAFGVQLNPEVAAKDADYLLRHLQAYCLLSDWLRESINIDVTRRILPFIDRFPLSYTKLILQKSYRPTREQLIDDYLQYNPTRNRELDMLPLFRHLDETRVISQITSSLIKARPTFHYRLPNASFNKPGWSLAGEWNRWLKVEKLAHAKDRLSEMAAAFLQNQSKVFHGNWARMSAQWVEP
ncbi:amidoligase family protein [Fodinicurvata halophila]|uniref:Amidoligase family protein n=1 Tax=Fodinicurvata halophila TaxID=1419723 RepID=A0ABV8UJH1_9PROT